jgi:hypothetical protein
LKKEGFEEGGVRRRRGRSEGSQMLALGVVDRGVEKVRRKDGGLTTTMGWSHTFMEKRH